MFSRKVGQTWSAEVARRAVKQGVLVILLSAWSLACSGAKIALSPGDAAPPLMESDGQIVVMIVGSVDDCLSCDLLGVFVALRALQAQGDGTNTPKLVILAVASSKQDTLFFRHTLERERLAGTIKTVVPRAASKVFDPNSLPAMYLIDRGLIVDKWEPSLDQGTAIVIERNDLVRAVSKRTGSVSVI